MGSAGALIAFAIALCTGTDVQTAGPGHLMSSRRATIQRLRERRFRERIAGQLEGLHGLPDRKSPSIQEARDMDSGHQLLE